MMFRDYIIFSTTGNGNGYAKVEDNGFQMRVAISVRGYYTLKKDEVFKAYMLEQDDQGGQRLLGTLDGGKGIFTLNGDVKFDTVIVARKNVNTGTVSPEFWGFKKGTSFDVKNIVFDEELAKTPSLSDEYTHRAAAMQGTTYAQPELKDELSDDDVEFPHYFGQQAQEAQPVQQHNSSKSISGILKNYGGGGFSWQRVNGYFSMFNYTIIQYILSSQQVYSSIMAHGYYIIGVKEDPGCTYIAIVLPVSNPAANPFEHIGEFSNIIAQTDEDIYHAVCVGIDEGGEFFCNPE